LGFDEYKLAEDQIESTIKFISQQTMFKLIIQQPIIICIYDTFFDSSSKEQITKTVVNATYNTNRLKYKLYTVFGIINGQGFPLIYLLLNPIKKKSAQHYFKLAIFDQRIRRLLCSYFLD
ncbi:13900_t:CDS:1, partial [Gigaspora margarita]